VSRRVRGSWGLQCDVALVLVAVLVLGGPALFTLNGFGLDYTNHLWLVSVQTQAIQTHLSPTYFLDAPQVGIFYPFYMFYGGSLYAIAGGLGALLGGDSAAAFILVSLLAVAAAYGGLVWLARQVGVRGWMAHAPAVAFVGSAYYVSNYYARGAWPEFIATSAFPLLAASGWRIVGSDRIEPLPAALFVASTIFFAGSHNVTLLLGSLFLIVTSVLLRVALGSALSPNSLRRLVCVAGLFLLGVGVDAWFLVPDIAHGSLTQAGSGPIYPWSRTGALATPGLVFNPLRSVPSASATPALYVQAPDWLLAWAIAAGAILWSQTRGRVRRAGLALVVVLVGTLVAYLSRGVWDGLPKIVRQVQFPYRLSTYVALCVAGLVLIMALALQRAPGPPRRRNRALAESLGLATAVSIALCVWQLWVPDTDFAYSYRDVRRIPDSPHVLPSTWYAINDYADAGPSTVAPPTINVPISASAINSDHVTLKLAVPKGLTRFTIGGLAAAPYAVTVAGGVVRVGRTRAGVQVLRRSSPGRGAVTISLGPAGGSVTTGRDISLASLAILLILALRPVPAILSRRVGKRSQQALPRGGGGGG
jgi:hypothetical protein